MYSFLMNTNYVTLPREILNNVDQLECTLHRCQWCAVLVLKTHLLLTPLAPWLAWNSLIDHKDWFCGSGQQIHISPIKWTNVALCFLHSFSLSQTKGKCKGFSLFWCVRFPIDARNQIRFRSAHIRSIVFSLKVNSFDNWKNLAVGGIGCNCCDLFQKWIFESHCTELQQCNLGASVGTSS